MRFKRDFLLGAATAAHQVEGNNKNSDCWAQEQMPHSSYTEPSLLACDHYNRYEEDIELMAKAGLNAFRFTIEWARIEPEEGKFDEVETEHYRRVIACLREHGIEPVVTLHHFSSPVWLIKKGGWEAESTVQYFRRYAEYAAKNLLQGVKYVCTINEANMGIQIASISERYMKIMREAGAKASMEGSVQVGMNFDSMMESMRYSAEENAKVFGTPQPQIFVSSRTKEGDILIMRAHMAAKEAIKAVCPEAKVGLTLSLHDLQCTPGGEKYVKQAWDEEFTHYLPYIGDDDFLGVQNYTRTVYGKDGELPVPDGAEVTQMDYEYYPEGLEHVLRKVNEDFRGELLVTENGIATDKDERRAAFIDTATKGVAACIADGLPVKGYLHWSLLDNFEWQKGFAMTFGLVAVDRENGYERRPKDSLAFLGSLIER